MATEARTRIAERAAEAVAPARRAVLRAFVDATIRRLSDAQLGVAGIDAVAAELVEAFRFVDEREQGEVAIRVRPPDRSPTASGTVLQVSAEDRPFLLSTITEELDRRGLHPLQTLHPVFGVERSVDGPIVELLPARGSERRESFVHIELEEALDTSTAEDLHAALASHLHDVVVATDDHDEMRARVAAEAERLLDAPPPHVEREDVEEVAALLRWLLDDNLVLLGLREYDVIDLPGDHPHAPGRAARVRSGTGAGILGDEATSRLAEPVPLDDLPAEQRDRFLSPELVTVSRTNRLSTVHRRARMEYIGVKRFDHDGRVCGEFRILGLFTRKGYTEPSRNTPVLRRKLDRILEREDVVPGSHDEATLVSLFQALPKDELFQSDLGTLHRALLRLYRAEERQETTLSLRTDPFTRTASVLVSVPRDRYSPDLRHAITELLLDRFGGTHVDVDLSLGERSEALVRFSVNLPSRELPDVDVVDLQRRVRQLARTWSDEVVDALVAARGEEAGRGLARRFADRFPRSYRETTTPAAAVADIAALDALARSERTLSVALRRTGGTVELQAFRRGTPLELSGFLPILESLGLVVIEEVPHRLHGDDPALHVQNFAVRGVRGHDLDVTADGDRIADAVLAAWNGQLEVDSLNQLILVAGLSWRQVTVLRAYRRYRRQVGTAYTTGYINDTLVGHPEVARALMVLFEARFEPQGGADEPELEQLRRDVLERCDAVERLDQDRILRGFLALIEATLRTNVYRADAVAEQPDGRQIPYLSLKFDPSRVPGVPKPVPHREIFVYSPTVEGVHLRGGPVARGGIRWSDRQDDVRTEVLGLMKAQMLKNAVIVPTGAKGGFVLKAPPEDPHRLRAAVERQYVTFIRGLLDITDDIEEGRIVTPDRVVRHDGDDPYLVVAADKGTATLSDLANAVAEDYGFWLGDAFASGGSRGYDHKALGITARGAWVAVRRHFRELGVDPETERISVAGIGDMSGDVFGNGMLCSRTIALVAAFDHRDIFLDPDPDPAVAFEERRRLFDLPRSSWQDYDRDRISAGGGVHPRSAKRIEITPQVKEALRIDDDALSPAELIRAILRAPVDLLFAGGIGTYVKASGETHDEIGDRANDDLRIDANELRARVYGEGANLSITQRGRIQYARHGGRIDQDAIDNAGGVDTSDHEVNIKVLLGRAREEGRIDAAERDELLAAVTDDVVAAVLRNVDLQTWRLSQELADSPRWIDAYEQLLQRLEAAASLDRTVEALPGTEEMAERAEVGAGLTRPELATLLGYAKRTLATALVDTGLPDQAALRPTLAAYFPGRLVERFADLLPEHRLRRELVAMMVANDVVDRMGITTPFRLQSETGAPLEVVLAAYWAAREVAGADRAWRAVEDTDGLLGPERQLELKREVDGLVLDLWRRYLPDPDLPDVAAVVDRDRPVFEALARHLVDLGTPDQRQRRLERAQRLIDDLVEEDLASFVACTRDLGIAPDVARVLRELDRPGDATAVADAFLRLSSELAIERLQRVLTRLEPEERWARWQHGGLTADLRTLRTDAVAAALREEPSLPEPEAVERFLAGRADALGHALALVRDVAGAETPTLDAVAVAARTLREALGG